MSRLSRSACYLCVAAVVVIAVVVVVVVVVVVPAPPFTGLFTRIYLLVNSL